MFNVINDLTHRDASRALRKMIKKTVINVINPPREGKHLLVLDLDHTLLHFSTEAVGTDKHEEMMVRVYVVVLFPFNLHLYRDPLCMSS